MAVPQEEGLVGMHAMKAEINLDSYTVCLHCSSTYNETCVRKPPLRLSLVVDVDRWLL